MREVGMQRAVGRISIEYQGHQSGFYSQHKEKTLEDFKQNGIHGLIYSFVNVFL